jgi:hypothetical protein
MVENSLFWSFYSCITKFGIVAHWVLGLDVWKLSGVSILVLVQEPLVVMGKTFYGQGLITPR